jgi:hypothetical protein
MREIIFFLEKSKKLINNKSIKKKKLVLCQNMVRGCICLYVLSIFHLKLKEKDVLIDKGNKKTIQFRSKCQLNVIKLIYFSI